MGYMPYSDTPPRNTAFDPDDDASSDSSEDPPVPPEPPVDGGQGVNW